MGPRKREVGLIASAKLTAVTKEPKAVTILSKEKRKRENFYFDLSFDDFKIVKQLIFQ